MSRNYEEVQEVKEKKVRKVDTKKLIRILKMVLFITMLGLSFLVADKLADIILHTTLEMLSRIINIVLVVVVVAIYFKK